MWVVGVAPSGRHHCSSCIRSAVFSFVTRAGRLSIAQARALEELGQKFLNEYAKAPLDFEQAFGRKAPVILEIGFGMGDTTSHIARACPRRTLSASRC